MRALPDELLSGYEPPSSMFPITVAVSTAQRTNIAITEFAPWRARGGKRWRGKASARGAPAFLQIRALTSRELVSSRTAICSTSGSSVEAACHFSRTVPASDSPCACATSHRSVGACRLALVWPCASCPTRTAWAPDSTHTRSLQPLDDSLGACRVRCLKARLVRMRCTDSAMVEPRFPPSGVYSGITRARTSTTPSPALLCPARLSSTKSSKVRQLLAERYPHR